MGHLVAAGVYLCGDALTSQTTGSGGGRGLGLPLLVGVFAAFTAIGAIVAIATFVLSRRLPVPGPAPIPIWDLTPRS
jgi:hypothetical protein